MGHWPKYKNITVTSIASLIYRIRRYSFRTHLYDRCIAWYTYKKYDLLICKRNSSTNAAWSPSPYHQHTPHWQIMPNIQPNPTTWHRIEAGMPRDRDLVHNSSQDVWWGQLNTVKVWFVIRGRLDVSILLDIRKYHKLKLCKNFCPCIFFPSRKYTLSIVDSPLLQLTYTFKLHIVAHMHSLATLAAWVSKRSNSSI